MDPASNDCPRSRIADLIVQELIDETVVYDPRTHAAHRLNPAAALVLRLCDGHTTVDDVADALARELGGDPEPDAARLSIRRLADAGLIDVAPEADASEDHDDAERARSRRAALRRAVKVGAVAVVAGLAVPDAAFASPV